MLTQFPIGWASFRGACHGHTLPSNQGELCLPSSGFIHVPDLQKVPQVGHLLANTLPLTKMDWPKALLSCQTQHFGLVQNTALFKKDLRCWTREIVGYPMVRQTLNYRWLLPTYIWFPQPFSLPGSFLAGFSAVKLQPTVHSWFWW